MSKARDLANAGTALGAVDATELGYLDGVTSAVQTQINSKIGSASAINPTIVDAKGDIVAATAADTVARLAVGTNGQVLTAASGEATGLSWTTPAAGDKSQLWHKESGYYIKPYTSAGYSNAELTAGTVFYIPIYLPNYPLDRIGFRTSVNTVNMVVRMGIYNADLTTGKPSTVYLDAGTVTANTTNTNFQITISTTPPAGYYFLAINCQSVISGGVDVVAQTRASSQFGNFGQTTSTLEGTSFTFGFTQTGVTGAFATAGTLTPNTNSNPILVAVRMA
jgi:hypothetical protein